MLHAIKSPVAAAAVTESLLRQRRKQEDPKISATWSLDVSAQGSLISMDYYNKDNVPKATGLRPPAGTVDPWFGDIPMSARFSMMGHLQAQHQNQQPLQALDFSSRSSPMSNFSPHQQYQQQQDEKPMMDAVDLSMRGRSTFNDDTSSSSTSPFMSERKPPHSLLLPQLLKQEPQVDPVLPIPVVAPPPLPTFFKKSPNATRPFKAYPKDLLSLPLGMVMGGVNPAADHILNTASNEAYIEFRRQMLSQVVAAKTRRVTSPQMKSDSAQPTQPEEAGSPQQPSSSAADQSGCGGNRDTRDAAYWERRRKNNEAAKRSRDARRLKEDDIAIRATFLEGENMKLRLEVLHLQAELQRVQCLLSRSSR